MDISNGKSGMNDKHEDLDGLLVSLYGEKAAEAVKEDIRLGDEILNSSPSPEPDAAVMQEVKRNVLAALARKRTHRRVMTYRSAVAAALFLVIAGLGIRFMTYHRTYYAGSGIATENVDTAGFFGNDLQLAILSDEIDEIESSIYSIDIDRSFSEPELGMDELEMEILEISSTFWRG